MNRRSFLKSTSLLIPATVVATLAAAESKQLPVEQIAICIQSGAPIWEVLQNAQAIASHKRCEVVFIWNYCDHFQVRPDKTWACAREGGGMPIVGPNSEFIPPEGWMTFFGH